MNARLIPRTNIPIHGTTNPALVIADKLLSCNLNESIESTPRLAPQDQSVKLDALAEVQFSCRYVVGQLTAKVGETIRLSVATN